MSRDKNAPTVAAIMEGSKLTGAEYNREYERIYLHVGQFRLTVAKECHKTAKAAIETIRKEHQAEISEQAEIIGKSIDDSDKFAMEKRAVEVELDRLVAKLAKILGHAKEYLSIYEGVYDMAVPVPHQSETAKKAEQALRELIQEQPQTELHKQKETK